MLNRLLHAKFGWAIVLLALVGINILFSLFHFRLDLTAEKRYTLSNPTKELLRKLDDKVDITVFLDGEMPAGFKKLAGSTEDMLSAFKGTAENNLSYRFTRPGEGHG